MNLHVNTDTNEDIKEVAGNEELEQYLTFLLDGEEYGVEIIRVEGIQGWKEVTKIPNTPQYMLGVINLRGKVIPILDLRSLFNLELRNFDSTTVVIIVTLQVQGGQHTLGMVVDGISETYRINTNDIQIPSDLKNCRSVNYLKGLVSVDEKLVILLDLDNLTRSNDISEIMQAAKVN